MKPKVTLKLELEITYLMGEDACEGIFDEEEYQEDLQILKNNLQGVVSLGMREGLFSDDTYSYIEDYKVVITEV